MILVILLNAENSLQNLIDCDQEVTETQFCKLGEVYPPPYSIIIQPTIHIFELSEINEDKKTITVYFQLYLKWNDTYAKLKLANFDKFVGDGWYDLSKDKNTATSILHDYQTTAKFINSQSVEYSFDSLWHKEPHFKLFAVILKETFYCDSAVSI